MYVPIIELFGWVQEAYWAVYEIYLSFGQPRATPERIGKAAECVICPRIEFSYIHELVNNW